jgi:uncharacterized protein
MQTPSVHVVESRPIDRLEYCLVGVPDIGLSGSIALSYMIQQMKMDELGYLDSDVFAPVIVVHEGKPFHPIRIYYKNHFAAIISEVALDVSIIPIVARSIVDWVRTKHVDKTIVLTGIAVPNRIDIETPAVFGVTSSPTMTTYIQNANISLFEEGFIAGVPAVILKECLKHHVQNIILLAQAHYQYPDPAAAASLVTTLSSLLGIHINTQPLLEQAEHIRVKMRELMQRTQYQMQRMQKGHEQEIPPLYT